MENMMECDDRIENILHSNMWMLGLLTTGLCFVTYQYGKLEDELKRYRSVDVESECESDLVSEGCSDSETDVVDEDELEEDEKVVEGVKTRSWFSSS